LNLILFGPPGVGKSTIIDGLQKLEGKFVALDSEKVWDDRAMKGRLRLLLQVYPQVQRVFGLPPLIVGGAGFDPSILYPGFAKVLLFLTQEDYEARRDTRNAMRPEFAKQGTHKVDEWHSLTKWNHVLSVNGPIYDVITAVAGLALSSGKTTRKGVNTDGA
jgi:hypothetical protein